MKNATLVLLINKDERTICLGMKKRGFGSNKWNGFGGKVKENENIKDAAIREVIEETSDVNRNGVALDKKDLNKVASLDFFFPHNPNWNQRVHVFSVNKWKGTPKESEEMRPKWFDIEDVPYDEMWSDDIYWLPNVLRGEKVNKAFYFDENNNLINNPSL
jgi:8-oxo-dGTP pyrophosphatase MutT (NUDIX family)